MSLSVIGGIISGLAGPLGQVAERYFDNKDDQQAFKNAVELEALVDPRSSFGSSISLVQQHS